MIEQHLTRRDLCSYFSIPHADSGDYRAMHNVLRTLGIKLRGGTTRWSIVWQALGLSAEQNQRDIADLTAPLLTARVAANLLGHADPSIVYRWSKGQLPLGTPPFPTAIDLSNGRANARVKRWRQAEVLAWHCGQPLPQYAKLKPVFGALVPLE